jgi:hypothetical protein
MKRKKGGNKRRIGRTRETKTEEKMRDRSRLVRRGDKSTTRNTEKDKGFQKQKERKKKKQTVNRTTKSDSTPASKSPATLSNSARLIWSDGGCVWIHAPKTRRSERRMGLHLDKRPKQKKYIFNTQFMWGGGRMYVGDCGRVSGMSLETQFEKSRES